jgi:hypothetical protein
MKQTKYETNPIWSKPQHVSTVLPSGNLSSWLWETSRAVRRTNSPIDDGNSFILFSLNINEVIFLRLAIAGVTVMSLLNLKYNVWSEDNSQTTGGISFNLLCLRSRTWRLTHWRNSTNTKNKCYDHISY